MRRTGRAGLRPDHSNDDGQPAWVSLDALSRRGRINDAKETARWLVETARERLASGETPEALRDLSISLNNVGNTDQALGDWEQARAAFTEGLEIARRLAAALPRHLDYKDLPEWFEQRLAELEAARAADQKEPDWSP